MHSVSCKFTSIITIEAVMLVIVSFPIYQPTRLFCLNFPFFTLSVSLKVTLLDICVSIIIVLFLSVFIFKYNSACVCILLNSTNDYTACYCQILTSNSILVGNQMFIIFFLLITRLMWVKTDGLLFKTHLVVQLI